MRSPFQRTLATKDILPNTLWELLELALQDIVAVEQDPRYSVSMTDWHDGSGWERDTCQVCLAGAVMAKRLDVPLNCYITPSKFRERTIAAKLYALDFLRDHFVLHAVEKLYGALETPEQVHKRVNDLPDAVRCWREIPSYDYNRNEWFAAMQQLLAELKAANI